MRYYICGAAAAGMAVLAATAAGFAQTQPAGNTPAATAPTPPATPATPSPAAPAVDKPQALAASPGCPPAPVHRRVAYHHRVRSRVSSWGMTASYNSAELVAAAPPAPPPPVYYAPPPITPVWYGPGPRPWFGGPWLGGPWWHHWGRPRW